MASRRDSGTKEEWQVESMYGLHRSQQGFQQIYMEPSDQEDTALITPTGIYFYIVMSFGLKNAGATYQRLANQMFKDELEDTMEI